MRLASESRRPGMTADRRCLNCRAPLQADDDVRCLDCAPRLSDQAQAANRKRAELRDCEREIHHLENTIKGIERALRKWPTT